MSEVGTHARSASAGLSPAAAVAEVYRRVGAGRDARRGRGNLVGPRSPLGVGLRVEVGCGTISDGTRSETPPLGSGDLNRYYDFVNPVDHP